MLQKEFLLTEICFDTAEDKPSEVCRLGYRYTVNTGIPVIQVYRSRRTGIPVLGSPVPVKPKLSSVRLPSVRLRRERQLALAADLCTQFKFWAGLTPNFRKLLSNFKFPNSPKFQIPVVIQKIWRSMVAVSNSKFPGNFLTKFHH